MRIGGDELTQEHLVVVCLFDVAGNKGHQLFLRVGVFEMVVRGLRAFYNHFAQDK